MSYTLNLNTRETKTGRSLASGGQPAWSSLLGELQSKEETISKHKVDAHLRIVL